MGFCRLPKVGQAHDDFDGRRIVRLAACAPRDTSGFVRAAIPLRLGSRGEYKWRGITVRFTDTDVCRGRSRPLATRIRPRTRTHSDARWPSGFWDDPVFIALTECAFSPSHCMT